MPALVAAREEPHVRGFHQRRIARGLKLLHANHGMWTSGTNFDGPKFYVDAA